jgi:2,4-dienoyl-CoA reductase (NADPH2)
MTDLAAEIRKIVNVPVITAGRISTGAAAEEIIATGKADLVGLARVLWADPEWPIKASEGREDEINHCDPACEDVCMQLVMKKKPAYCARWSPGKTRKFKNMFA